MLELADTIAAIATPRGVGAIAVIRVSGSKAYEVLKKIFIPRKPPVKPYAVKLGSVLWEGKKIDECIAVYFKSPNSYTGEDLVEFHTHGGMVVEEVLKVILNQGVRLAKPGEFTFRAFINGKIDLLKAEAINQLVNVSGAVAIDKTNELINGRYSKEFREIKEEILNILSAIEASLEFPDEVLEYIDFNKLKEIKDKLERIIKNETPARLLRNGIKIAIVGRPNVGKSSLLNAILKEERSIVTPIPGTTTDFIEEDVVFEGVLLRFIDTAGIKSHTLNIIEEEGIKRTMKILDEADFVYVVVEANKGILNEDLDIIKKIKKPYLIVANKMDLGKTPLDAVYISAKYSGGITELLSKTLEVTIKEVEFIGTERHFDIIKKIYDEICNALTSKDPEIISLKLMDAVRYIDELVGVKATQEVIEKIFSNFCIGK